ncbi:MAG: Bifunctional protein PutA, partial [Hyphomicrobiales bacterium]|nr:Bifunctional protein PutA [Hyphomicrobiales bacterium]
ARVAHPADTPSGVLARLAHRIGAPAVRAAARQAMRVLGGRFVLGETIHDALREAVQHAEEGERYSFDMLGEGARTADDAERYFAAYAHAIESVGRAGAPRGRYGVSVKLSALHPRFEATSHVRVLRELTPRLIALAQAARESGVALTVDAEEADRLELTTDVFACALTDPSLKGWNGLGLAAQAYQKRALALVDWLAGLAKSAGKRIPVRLVKGAYWDTEIKRAQERGLEDFPVFTRKAMTDLNYMACAQRLLALRPHLFPQFATHNALTVASVLERAGGTGGFEFQRLHGMGEALYRALAQTRPEAPVRIYAPVGPHRDLLAYLVRRLLENGANSSFVSRVADLNVPVAALLRRPQDALAQAPARHGRIVLPADLFAPGRVNSRGVEFGHEASLAHLLAECAHWRATPVDAGPLIEGTAILHGGTVRTSPIHGERLGHARFASIAQAHQAMEAAARHAPLWDATPVNVRAAMLERAADMLEARRGRFVALLQSEGGKTLDDALSEVREAADYCRYYAAQARTLFAPVALPGPSGEENLLRRRGRGAFVCISPWNFPLAIFMGQIVAALACGDAVVAKPAEQTPLVAFEAVRLLHEAGAPAGALHLAPGAGDVGAALVAHEAVAGVAFTGSTEVARLVNRALAAKDGPIVPFIAETGGINAMIVDATALPEQVADDVLASAFRSAGQRCSALRLLCVQDDIADDLLATIIGAARELKVGDPRDLATHIGPVIDQEAKSALVDYVRSMGERTIFAGEAPEGLYVAPHVIALDSARDLRREVFGPVLHVARWRGGDGGLEALMDDVQASGYGLTLGVHSRIAGTARRIAERLRAGNVYVNRSMIGAVVGSQPFGGSGLSGTGPKAGGPDYLTRFSQEQTLSTNTAAAGGNAALLATSEGDGAEG